MTSSDRVRDGRRSPGSDVVGLAVSVAFHILVLFLLPAPSPPVYDVYPLDYAGVVEISPVAGPPASPAPAPGVEISAEEPKPAVVQDTKPEPDRTTPAAVTTVEPVAKPQPVPKPTPQPTPRPQPSIAPVPAPEPVVTQPAVDEQSLVTSPSGDMPVATAPAPEEPAPVQVAVPQPTLAYEPAPSTPAATLAPSQAQVPQPGPGKPDGTGTVPRPEFPGTDPTGWSMVKTTGGSDHGVWIPKGVQNIGARGEAIVLVEVGSDGVLRSATIKQAPPDAAMTAPILNAVRSSWAFQPDRTEGRAGSYSVEFKIGYDGGSGEVWVNSLRAYY